MIISGRTSKSVAHRGSELDIEFIVQGSRNKLKSYSDEKTGISLEEVCYVGDDTVDIELLKNVGMSVIVPNSNPILRDQGFDCMTERVGGGGALRRWVSVLVAAQPASKHEKRMKRRTDACWRKIETGGTSCTTRSITKCLNLSGTRRTITSYPLTRKSFRSCIRCSTRIAMEFKKQQGWE